MWNDWAFASPIIKCCFVSGMLHGKPPPQKKKKKKLAQWQKMEMYCNAQTH